MVDAPNKKENLLMESASSFRLAVKINYLEKEQQNTALGKKGEELALAFERNLLILAGKEALAEKVEWVSENLGDGLGFVILSQILMAQTNSSKLKRQKWECNVNCRTFE